MHQWRSQLVCLCKPVKVPANKKYTSLQNNLSISWTLRIRIVLLNRPWVYFVFILSTALETKRHWATAIDVNTLFLLKLRSVLVLKSIPNWTISISNFLANNSVQNHKSFYLTTTNSIIMITWHNNSVTVL